MKTIEQMSITELRNEIYDLQQEEHEHNWQDEFTRQEIKEINYIINNKLSNMPLLERIAQWIIDIANKKTTECMWIVDYKDVMVRWNVELHREGIKDDDIDCLIVDELLKFDEVQEAFRDTDGYNITLYTGYIMGYTYECYDCAEDVKKNELKYQAIVIFKDETNNIEGNITNLEDAKNELEQFKEKYKNNEDVEQITLTNGMCPHCLAFID
jgi:hypothetical protein